MTDTCQFYKFNITVSFRLVKGSSVYADTKCSQPYFELIQVGGQSARFSSSHCSLTLTGSCILAGGGGGGWRGNAA